MNRVRKNTKGMRHYPHITGKYLINIKEENNWKIHIYGRTKGKHICMLWLLSVRHVERKTRKKKHIKSDYNNRNKC